MDYVHIFGEVNYVEDSTLYLKVDSTAEFLGIQMNT
jgi:hypothetical protein